MPYVVSQNKIWYLSVVLHKIMLEISLNILTGILFPLATAFNFFLTKSSTYHINLVTNLKVVDLNQ